ncbi:MAG: tetratricopeptide repeat protein [Fidelibacterota bacterium]
MLIYRKSSFIFLGAIFLVWSACVPPEVEEEFPDEEDGVEEKDDQRCQQLLSSAAEYYKNKDWKSTIRVYKILVDEGCDRGNEEQVYQFWAVAHERQAQFDSSENVLLQGLKHLPDNINLYNRLAYAYKRLGRLEDEAYVYEDILELEPENSEIMKELARVYGELKRFEEQIDILKQILELEPTNKSVEGDLAMAFQELGLDPIDIYRERYKKNPNNVSYGIDLVEQLMRADEFEEAIGILEDLSHQWSENGAVSKKLIFKKLAQAYIQNDQLQQASEAYIRLFDEDPGDFRTAIEIVTINLDIPDFETALEWVEKAIAIAPENGEPYGHKGNVYFQASQECRGDYPNMDDKIMASLALKYFKKSTELGYRKFRRDITYLSENADDLLFTFEDWFLLEDRNVPLRPSGDCYNWVKETLVKDPSWK